MKVISRQAPRRDDLEDQGTSGRVENREKKGKTSETDAVPGFRVLIVDRDSMSSHLLATVLSHERNIRASAVQSADLLRHLDVKRADMVIIGAEVNQDEFDLTQTVSRAHPSVLIVMLLNHSTRDSVLNAFRSGARGVFPRQRPIADLLDCVERVRNGYIWAAEQETTLLLDAIRSFPTPNLSPSTESLPLTSRQKQVVQFAARGKTNKVIAGELGLSEHTVKNYLFRAFERLGVSSRAELLFYLTMRGQTFGSTRLEERKAGPKQKKSST
jgi:two-component system, NarL family, nitrate/nitrite response regulator NarL